MKEMSDKSWVADIPAQGKKEKLLDQNLGVQYCGDSEEIYVEILQMFCDMKDKKQRELQEAYDARDWKNYTIQIHALKSGALNIGGKELSARAAELEKAGKQSDEAYILKEHDAMMHMYDDTADEALQYLEGK